MILLLVITVLVFVVITVVMSVILFGGRAVMLNSPLAFLNSRCVYYRLSVLTLIMKSRWLPVIGICGRKELLCIPKLVRDIHATQRGHPNDFNEFPVVSPEGGSLHGLAQQYWYRC